MNPNEFHLLGDELEREILTVHQSLFLKSSQLDETRKKLHNEMIEHQKAKNLLDRVLNEKLTLKMELDLNAKANAKLEEENAKCRESIARLQTQMDSYTAERNLLTDRCHNADIEICMLRSQVTDLQDKMQEYLLQKDKYEQYQLNMKNLVDQISRKQEILNEEQNRLEKAMKEALEFTTNLTEELNIQYLFVNEANLCRVQLENHTLRLLGVLEAERNEKRKLMQPTPEVSGKQSYLADWKASQDEMNQMIYSLTSENKKLVEELETLKAQMDLMYEKDL